jgi:four helix bundle protein
MHVASICYGLRAGGARGGRKSPQTYSVQSHTSLIPWQRAHAVARMVLRATRLHWKPWAFAVIAQLQRSSLSVQLNIAEGYARRSHGAFRLHLEIAYGSAVETADLLRLCLEEEILPEHSTQAALQDCAEAQAVILGLLKRLRR